MKLIQIKSKKKDTATDFLTRPILLKKVGH